MKEKCRMEVKVDIRRYLLAIKKNVWKIGIATIICFFIALIFNYKVKDDGYSSTASVYSAAFGSVDESLQGVTALKTYSEIITSKDVADRAAKIIGNDEINGDMIKGMVSYSYDETSPIYRIKAVSNSPSLSITVANAVANAFVIKMNTITGEGSAQILDEAYNYEKEFDGKKEQIKGIVLITLIGMALSIVVVIGYSALSGKAMSVHDVTMNGELEIIGVIPNFDVE